MEEWRNLAEEAANGCFAYTVTNDVADAIAIARQRYGLAAEECRGFGQGVLLPPNAGQGASAGGDFVDLVLAQIKSISRFRAMLASVFSLCAERIGLQGNALRWRHRWQIHHADAARHAETAIRCLRSAKSHGHAALRVFHCMLRPPSPQEVAHAWAPAAEQLLRRAIDELAMAEATLGQIRQAIVAEYSDACLVVHGL